jgi:hypothetical protein
MALKKVEIMNYPDVTVYDLGDMLVTRISDMPESIQEAMNEFVAGQTMPYVQGESPQDFIYLGDYDNFMNKHMTGKELFWD